MKNLVLGVAKGYDWYTLEPFVNSFAKNCPSAELVLFVDDISDFTRDKLIGAGVIAEKFPDRLDGIPNNTRWKIFRDFLDVHGDEYGQIFITDTRDVIFQADVFARFKGLSNWLGCVTEGDDIAGSKTGDQVNYDWLEACFGKTEADKLADRKIICCGTIIGSAAEMKTFCRELWKILEHKTGKIFDQAVTNYLAYNGLLPIKNLYEIDVVSGEILTMYLFSQCNVLEIRDGMILRVDGGIPAVVHQYDKRDELNLLVNELYRSRDFQFDKRFNDPRSLLEQCCSLLCVNKIAEATRMFLKVFFTTAEFGAYASTLIEILTAVSRKTFSPNIELLELSVQNALSSVKNFSDTQLINIHKTLVLLTKNHHAVDPEFKASLVAQILKFAEINLADGAEDYFFACVEMIKSLDLPLNEKFQRRVAEVKRIFGRKDEALAAYKKVPDLS